MNKKGYVIIHGLAPSHLLGHGDRSDAVLQEYVSGIVYGTPDRVFGVMLGTGKFVALVEWSEAQVAQAAATFERMSSFSYGAVFPLKAEVAWQEFGSWIGHYSGCIEPAAVL